MHAKHTVSIFFSKVVFLKTLSTSQSHKHTGLETRIMRVPSQHPIESSQIYGLIA